VFGRFARALVKALGTGRNTHRQHPWAVCPHAWGRNPPARRSGASLSDPV